MPAELPYQTYARIFGRPWPGGRSAEIRGYLTALGIAAAPGSAAANVALQNALIGGWRPGAAAGPSPAPAPAPSPAPTPTPATPSPTALPVQPGLAHEEFLLGIALQEFMANLTAELERERLALEEQRAADARLLTEAQLAANPADFVAYELYKRSLVEQGFTPTSAPRSDEAIQNLFELALGLPEERASAGAGRFGVDLPVTGEFSRAGFGDLSATDLATLTSFLNAGVETQADTFQGINPADYFQEVQEGFIPTISSGRTQVIF